MVLKALALQQGIFLIKFSQFVSPSRQRGLFTEMNR
jgi:hypothetical protein